MSSQKLSVNWSLVTEKGFSNENGVKNFLQKYFFKLCIIERSYEILIFFLIVMFMDGVLMALDAACDEG